MNHSEKSKTFDEVLPLFLADVRIQLQKKSYAGYVSKTKIFSAWLAENSLSNHRMRNIDSQIISTFFTYLATERILDKPTCQKYFLVLRSMWRYAKKRDWVSNEPFDLITYPKKGVDKGAQVIPPEDSKILLDDMKENAKQLYLAYMTEFYLCLRPGRELRLLKLSEIDFNNGTVTVLTENAKTGRKRVVTIPQQLLEIFIEYDLDKYDKHLYVFGNNKQGIPGDSPWSENMLRYKFNQIRDRHNFPKSYQLYSAKHSSITLLHNSGAPLLTSMTHVGHTTLSSHQAYLHKHIGIVNETIRAHYPNPY
jgi:integrase